MIGIDDLPTLLARMLTTDAELILDRCNALIVGRIAGVKRDPAHGVLSGSNLHFDSAISAAVKRHVFIGVRPHSILACVAPGARQSPGQTNQVDKIVAKQPVPIVAMVRCRWRRPAAWPARE